MGFVDVVSYLIRVPSECFVHILSSNDVWQHWVRTYVWYGLASRGSNLAHSPIVVNCRLAWSQRNRFYMMVCGVTARKP